MSIVPSFGLSLIRLWVVVVVVVVVVFGGSVPSTVLLFSSVFSLYDITQKQISTNLSSRSSEEMLGVGEGVAIPGKELLPLRWNDSIIEMDSDVR